MLQKNTNARNVRHERRSMLACAVGILVGALAPWVAGPAAAHGPNKHLFLAGPSTAEEPPADTPAAPLRWWKGNTHTHSWWSDGDAPPESIAMWYRERGYHFLVFSDHNRMQQGVAWRPMVSPQDQEALASYRRRFGDDWVEQRVVDGKVEVKLKTLDEFRTLVEVPGEFALIRGLEITDRFYEHPVHVNATNVDSVILPHGGDTIGQVIQNNLEAVNAHERRSGRPVFATLNHPNFLYAITADDLIPLQHAAGEGFLEIYNGHSDVRNEGDESHPSVERMWDIVLAKRLGELGLSVVYGIASDDAHAYSRWGIGHYNPGRGWIMVRASRLTPDSITAAIKRGDFYATTGVELRDVSMANQTLSVVVEPAAGVDYTIEFIGTRRDADLRPQPAPVAPPGVPGRTGSTYSDDIGQVLKRVPGTRASYALTDRDIYVRARVVSTRPHPNPNLVDDLETAWTQPLIRVAGSPPATEPVPAEQPPAKRRRRTLESP